MKQNLSPMKQMGLSSKVRMKKCRSYKGEIGRIAPNLPERDFWGFSKMRNCDMISSYSFSERWDA